MNNKLIRCGLLGGQEKDLYALGELHKQSQVEIVFIYDKDPGSVGLEIGEILGIAHPSDPAELDNYTDIEYVVVSEPRGVFNDELAFLSSTGARIISQTEAMTMFLQEPARAQPPQGPAAVEPEPFSLEDTLAAFERLFDRQLLLKFLLDVSVRAAGATAGSIMLYSGESGELYIAYATGLSERVVRNTRQKLGEGIAGAVAAERRGKLIRESPDRPLYPADRDRSGIQSAISVPLEKDERLLGVLNVSSDSDKKELTEEGLRALEKMSPRISSVLIESLRLQETRIRHREMNLRKSMGELAEKAISTQAKFSLISNMLSQLVSADTVELFVGTREGDWLVLGGSSRRHTIQPEMVRCERGALSRAYLERRTIVLTETVERRGEPDSLVSSFAFVPLHLRDALGVLMLEFSDPYKLDEFLVIKDSVNIELSRFLVVEKREKNMRRELEALSRVSDAAPILLTCHTLDDLCDFVSRLVADVVEAERVSVRIHSATGESGKVARFESTPDRSGGWMDEDEERFLKLKSRKQPFSLAFLNFTPETGPESPAYHSLLAVPISIDDQFRGGIIVYDKHPANPLEDATFTELDSSIIQHIVSIVEPAIRSISQKAAAAKTGVEEAGTPTYDEMLRGNFTRLKKVMESEMSRSDRYHHAFSLLLLKIRPLDKIFEQDEAQAIALVDEITRGIQTRTRKTDYGSWIRRDTFAMVSLEGSRRIRFLISRLMLYLLKDFDSVADITVASEDVLVAHSIYPGTAKTPEALFGEVEDDLAPYRKPD